MPLTLRTFFAAYPWDLVDEGIEAVLDRLHGDVGINGLSVWVGLPPVTQLRLREPEHSIFRTAGGLFFAPDKQHYLQTRCKPLISDWLKKAKDPLPRIAEACAARGVELRVIVSAAATGRFAHHYPEMASKNVFAAVSHTSLCLANPDVQAYLCGLAADLSTKYDLAGLVVTDLVIAWLDAFSPDLHPSYMLGDTERALLAMCFCESCQQKASGVVPGSLAAEAVRTILHEIFELGVPTEHRIDRLLSDYPTLSDYDRWRSSELSTFLASLKESCRCPLLVLRTANVLRTAKVQRTANVLRPATRGAPVVTPSPSFSDAIDVSVPAAVITQIDNRDELRTAPCAGAAGSELGLSESFVLRCGDSELVTALAEAVGLGLTVVQIDNYGNLPERALTPIKQAIRFARRTADD